MKNLLNLLKPSLGLLALIMFANIIPKKQTLQQTLLREYTKTIDANVHPLLKPVKILSHDRGFTCGYGTMVHTKIGEPNYILTANSLFKHVEGQEKYQYFSFESLTDGQKLSSGDISKVNCNFMRESSHQEGIEDVALCFFGKKNLIKMEADGIMSMKTTPTSRYYLGKFKTTIRSIVDGRTCEIIGFIKNDHNVFLWIALYDSFQGETGAGFLGNDGTLFILSKEHRPNNSMRELLDIPSEFKTVTFFTTAIPDYSRKFK